MNFTGILILSSILTTVCVAAPQDSIFNITLSSIKGEKIDLTDIQKSKLTLFIFFSPECPICEKYSLRIKDLETAYRQHGVHTYLVFPGTHFNSTIIRNFLTANELDLTALLDTEYQLTLLLKATVTPEAFLIDSNGDIIYSGMIDNWFYSLGKRRGVVTEYFIRDAINASLNGKSIAIKKTNPVGCYIYGLRNDQKKFTE